MANCSGTYAAWQVNGYTVLDLSKFVSSGGFNPATNPVLMTIRETLPNMQPANPFNCSSAAVPVSTAEYTSLGGLMGPYVPQIDYVDPPSSGKPLTNSPSTAYPPNWPEAYWPPFVIGARPEVPQLDDLRAFASGQFRYAGRAILPAWRFSSRHEPAGESSPEGPRAVLPAHNQYEIPTTANP